MALPAQKPLSVRGEVYLGGILPIGSLRMTLPAEFPCLGFRWSDDPRAYLMLHRSSMTCCAADQRMRRDTLDRCNLAMTGGAFPRDLRWHRIVRVVTRKTRFKRIVQDGIYLGKSCGARRIVCVTPEAEIP